MDVHPRRRPRADPPTNRLLHTASGKSQPNWRALPEHRQPRERRLLEISNATRPLDGKTPYSQIQSASNRFLAALHSNVQAFSNERWPARVRDLVNSEISHVRAILASARAPALLTTTTMAAWRATLTRNATASSHAAHLLRRALGVPELIAAK